MASSEGEKQGEAPGFSRPRAALHWLMALLVMIMLAGGLLSLAPMSDADPAKLGTMRAHMIVGIATLAALIFYGVATLVSKRPPKASSGNRMLDMLAKLVHIGLPLCVLVMIASGIATANLAGLPEILFDGKGEHIPEWVRELPSFKAHATAARILLGLLGLHILGALYHQFVMRDGLLSRMSLRKRR